MMHIDEYIKSNVDAFDSVPSAGHFERFEAKLKERRLHNRRRLVRRSMRIAGVGVLLIMSSLYVGQQFFSTDSDHYINPELQQAEYYYKTQISDGLTTISRLGDVLSEEQQAALMQEMGVADSMFQELQMALSATPDDPRVIDAMLQHYRVKALVVDRIVNDLERINKIHNDETKTTSHEM